jgi:hypothetical protein
MGRRGAQHQQEFDLLEPETGRGQRRGRNRHALNLLKSQLLRRRFNNSFEGVLAAFPPPRHRSGESSRIWSRPCENANFAVVVDSGWRSGWSAAGLFGRRRLTGRSRSPRRSSPIMLDGIDWRNPVRTWRPEAAR